MTDSLGISDPTLAAVTITVNSVCVPTIIKDATTSGSSQSWSHTVGSGNDRLLVIAACYLNSTIFLITYGARSFTEIIENVRQGDKKVAIWYLVNPNLGMDTITVNVSMAAATLKPVSCP